MSDSLRPHGLQHARLPCPSLSPRVCSDSCVMMIIMSVMPSNHLILCRPLLLVLNPQVSGVGLGLVFSFVAPEAHRTSSHAPSAPSCELFWVRLGLNLLSSPVPGRLLTHQRLLSSKAIQLLAQGLALILTFITVVGWPRGRPLWKQAVPGLGDMVGRAGLPDLGLCSTTFFFFNFEQVT